jgi:hypothetical protein
MAVTNFVPEIWSARILTAFSKNATAVAVTNRDYEGDIRNMGDTVNITNFTDPTIRSYTAHSDITIEDVDDATQALAIDQANYFAFEVDDVEKAQSVSGGAILAEATRRAAYGLSNTLDAYVLSQMAAGASNSAPDHDIAEATISTAANAYAALVDWNVLLDEADVPDMDRFAVISPAFYGLLLKDDRFVATGDAAAASTRANGRVGEAAGLTIYKSNNLPDGPGAGAGKYQLVGYRGATTLAEQLRSVEADRMEARFADLVKGLHLYGVKVTRPTGLVAADVIVS